MIETKIVAVVRIYRSNLAMAARPDALATLLDAARRFQPSPQDREEQRRSFAFGNTAFENELITRAMIDEQAERLASEKDDQQR